jgi:cytoskeletal protein RodZ
MNVPYGTPAVPPRKSRSPLYIALACGCALLLALALVGAGVGVFLLSKEPADEPTDAPTTMEEGTTEDPTDEPTEEPTDEETTEEPTSEEPTTEEPTEESLVSISSAGTQEGTTIDTEDEQLETENGKFVGIALTLENTGSEIIGLSGDNFIVYDTNGITYSLRYASFSTAGPEIAPGETATAALYVDVAEDVVIDAVSYTDAVGTGGAEVSITVG